MRIGDLSGPAAQLKDALKSLNEVWGEASELWTDANSRNFAENHLEPLNPKIRAVMDATNRMAEVLARARRECE